MYIQINELEKDILREIMNVGISKAADAFAVLTHSDNAIMLSVPEVKIVEPSELRHELTRYENAVMAIKTELKGDLTGISLLLFFDDQMDWIVQHALSEKDLQHPNLPALRLSLLLETSNILTGALLTQLVNILGMEVIGLPPVEIIPGPGQSIDALLTELPTHQPIVLSVRTDFMDQSMSIEMPLLLILEVSSLSGILNIIRQKGVYDSELLKKPNAEADSSAELQDATVV